MSGRPAQEHRERELKFDVPERWTLPDLASRPGSVAQESVRLESTYFDTAGGDLLRHGLTLRHRTGGTDTGWQLKVPEGDARVEVRYADEGGDAIPEPLLAATFGVRGAGELMPVAVLTTARAISRLCTVGGAILAEIALDDVTARRPAAAQNATWRELEVELVDGGEDALRGIADRLLEAGARPATNSSKLARALGIASGGSRDVATLPGLVGAYLDRQHQVIIRSDVDYRRGTGSIHDWRTSIRRYRSALRVFRDVLDPARAAALDAELAWHAATLGEVRDRQVLGKHVEAVLAELPPDAVLGPVADRIRRTLGAELARAEAVLTQAVSSPRYLELLAELGRWRERLPVTASAPAPAARAILRGTRRKVKRRLARAPQHDGRDVALHRARKAAKRARYAAELTEPYLGATARSAAQKFEELQTRLGVRQDAVVAAAFLRRVADDAAAAGESTFTYGVCTRANGSASTTHFPDSARRVCQHDALT